MHHRFRLGVAGLAALSAAGAVAGTAVAARSAAPTLVTNHLYGGGYMPNRFQGSTEPNAFVNLKGNGKTLVFQVDANDTCHLNGHSYRVMLHAYPSGIPYSGARFSASGTDPADAGGGETPDIGYSLTGRVLNRGVVTGTVTLRGSYSVPGEPTVACDTVKYSYVATDPTQGGLRGAVRRNTTYYGNQYTTQYYGPFMLRVGGTPRKLEQAMVEFYFNCSSGVPAAENNVWNSNIVYNDAIGRSGSFHDVDDFTLPLNVAPGGTIQTHSVIAGHFSAHRLSGTWTLTGTVYNTAHQPLGTCTSGTMPIAAARG